MIVVWYVLIFVLGAAVGSFLNVLISRTVEGEAWMSGRSHCDYCKHTLCWYELVPILSFFWFRGKSHCCKKKLSYQHPLVESLVGLLFVWWAALSSGFFMLVTQPGKTVQPIFWLLTGLILLAIALTDLYYGVIPLPYLLSGVGVVLIYRLILVVTGSYQLVDMGWSALAGLALAMFYQFLRWVTRGRGMGEGDVWLGMYLGLVVGWPRIYLATMVAFVVGAIVGVGLILLRLKTRKDTLPFGPFMVFGALISLLLGI